MTKCSLCFQQIQGSGYSAWPVIGDETARCCETCKPLVAAYRVGEHLKGQSRADAQTV